jgi:hypothetical protein
MQEPDYKALIKLHKAWADRFMILWFVFAVTLFAGVGFFLGDSTMEPAVRTDGFILLAVIVIVGAVWQAAGMTIARIHMLMEGIVPPDVKKHKDTHLNVIPRA